MASEEFHEDIDVLIQREEEELNIADERLELKTSFEQEICKNLNKNLKMAIDDVIEKQGMTKTQRDHVIDVLVLRSRQRRTPRRRRRQRRRQRRRRRK